MAAKKGKGKSKVVALRVRVTDEQADAFAKRYEKEHDLKGKEATDFWRRYGARRLLALERDQKKPPKQKHKHAKAA